MPKRKKNRLEGYDYSQQGCYYITICTMEKNSVLSRIVADSGFEGPKIEYSNIGIVVKELLDNFNVNHTAQIDKYVIMPNHIHIILFVQEGTPRTASPTKAAVPKIINAMKSLTTKKIGRSIWQRSYHDHVIRDEADYLTKWNYIDTNPAKWAEDEYYYA